MKRLLLCLVPWMVLTVAAHAFQGRAADVIYTYHSATPQRAFRVGDECFVPIDELSEFGWQVDMRGDLVEITAEGHKLTIPSRTFGDKQTIPVRQTVSKIGGVSSWLPLQDRLQVYGVADLIEVKGGQIRFASPLAVKPLTVLLTSPYRVVFDFVGCHLGPKTEQHVDASTRVWQYSTDTVRVVMELPFEPLLPKNPVEAGTDLKVDVTPPTVVPPVSIEPKDHAPPSSTPAVTTPPAAPSTTQLPLSVQSDSPASTVLVASLKGLIRGAAQFRKPDPSTLEITLPYVKATVPDGFKLQTDAVESVSAREQGPSTVLVLKLARPMGAQVSTDSDAVRIELLKPDVGNGKLTGKVIVVDPGHGGHDRGAHIGEINEKDINLTIGLLLSRELAKAGATVIMTRKTDVFIPLSVRADIANKNQADFFISCHVNSTGDSSRQSGSITFHHLGKPICRVLGECIEAEIGKVSELPVLGTWSDGKIYRSGFSVLRGTTMPGVLLEVGFINHPRDRKRIVTPQFQSAVAKAVVQGLKVFLGDAKEEE